MRRALAWSVGLAFVTFTLFFGLEFVLEWWRLGRPGMAELSWAGSNNAKLVDLLSPMARAYNNVLAMLIATIGLAIPLTANMHTPKLIDMFLRDSINRVVLVFMAFGAAHVLWVDYIIGPKFAPMWAVRVAVMMAMLGWIIVIPYFFYVVRFLDPSHVVRRLRAEVYAIVRQVAAGQRDAGLAQSAVSERIDQLGTLAMKSLDRGDRGVAREAVWSFKQLIDQHAEYKARMPGGWFTVDRADFTGFSEEALEMLCGNHTWFEMKCGLQMSLGYQQALAKASDTVSSVSDANRVIALHAARRGDDEALRLCVRFFNNYVREAIKAKNLHAVYDVFHNYRLLASEVLDRDDLVREIAGHFAYYAVMARSGGLLFAPQMVVFDLGFVVRRAYDGKAAVASDLLDATLALPHKSGDEVLALAVKAKLLLGAYFVETEREAEAARVSARLRDVSAEHVANACRELLAAPRTFFEVTDRQLNLEYVRPERREPLRKFCASLTAPTSED